MKLKEIIDVITYGTHYKLIGAMSGKHLADSNINKGDYIKSFWDEDVSGMFPAFDAQKNSITKVPEYIIPVIVIWLSGK